MVQFFFSEPADFYLQWREGCCGHQAVQEFEHPNSNCSFWGTFRTWVKYRAAWMDLITSDKGDTAGTRLRRGHPGTKCHMHAAEWFKFQAQFGNRSRFWASICAEQLLIDLNSGYISPRRSAIILSRVEFFITQVERGLYTLGKKRHHFEPSGILLRRVKWGLHTWCGRISTQWHLRQQSEGLLSFSVSCGDKCCSLRRPVPATHAGSVAVQSLLYDFSWFVRRKKRWQHLSNDFFHVWTVEDFITLSVIHWPPFLSGAF